MTAVSAEREQEQAGVADAPCCSAVLPILMEGEPVELMQSPEPPVTWSEGRCPCGHRRDGWLCAAHAASARDAGCRGCFEDVRYPHDCPLFIRLIPRGVG